MNIAYIANPKSIHDCKWINAFSLKYKVVVICSELSGGTHLNNNIKTYQVLPKFPYKNILKRNKTLSLLEKIITKENIDIIHTMYAFPNAFWVNLINFQNHIITTRGSDILVDYKELFQPSNSFLNQRIKRFFIKQFHDSFNSAKYITSTSLNQQLVIKNFLNDQNKLILIRTGIDIKKFLLLTDNKLIKKNKGTIIFSPRSMKPIYNIDIIVLSFAKILHEVPNVKLLIINDFPNENYSNTILKLISDLKIEESCIITERLTMEKMVECYIDSDIVVSIPKTDGSPNSVLEAMLAKKNIIIGNYDYDFELFSELPKLKENTVEELANKIDQLLKIPMDMGIINKNFKLVNDLADLKKSIEMIDNLYISLI